ncbi:MAG: carboxypeptidase-like regulatory domain-containing protein [Bacteroidota bacterium]
MGKVYLSILLCFINTYSSLYAQERATLKGRLLDKETNAAVPFATVKLKNKRQGVISNAEGDFQLPYRYKLSKDTLVISCIGYKSRIIPLLQLEDDIINIIQLEASIMRLSEVIISPEKGKKLSAYRIVKTALNHIPTNYLQSSFAYEAYYRDYQIKDNQYINLNEAIVEVFDSGFHTNDQNSTRLKLLEYRKNNDFQRDTTTEIAYDNQQEKFIPNAVLNSFGGNELAILRLHDAIRNYKLTTYSFVYKMINDFIENHRFKLVKPSFLDNTYLYVITLRTKESVAGSNHFAEGKIYIEKNNFAIHKIDYAVYEKVRSKFKLLYDVQLEYAKKGSSMWLNYISFNNLFKLKNPLDFKVVNLEFNKTNLKFTITFNNQPKSISVSDKSNYKIRSQNKKMNVKEVVFNKHTGKRIYVFLEENKEVDFYKASNVLADEIKIKFENIVDVEGRLLGVDTFIEAKQFRELFVQKWNMDMPYVNDSLFVDKTKPLAQNISVPKKVQSSYWMNTPLKK